MIYPMDKELQAEEMQIDNNSRIKLLGVPIYKTIKVRTRLCPFKFKFPICHV